MAVKNLDQLYASSPSPTILTTALFLLRMAGVDYACTGENMVSLTMTNGNLRRLLKVPAWAVDEPGGYAAGRFVIHNSNICASKIDANDVEPDDGSSAEWDVYASDLDLLQGMYRALVL